MARSGSPLLTFPWCQAGSNLTYHLWLLNHSLVVKRLIWFFFFVICCGGLNAVLLYGLLSGHAGSKAPQHQQRTD